MAAETREARPPFAVRKEQLRARQVEAVADLVLGPPAVHRDHDGAERHRGPVGQDPLGRIGGEDGDVIAGADAVAVAECGGDGGDVPEMLAIAPAPAVGEDDVGLVAVDGGAGE